MSYQVPRAGAHVPCPRCGNPQVQPVTFTWWGGAVGPWLLKVVKCPQCGLSYRGATGGSPTLGIALYFGAGLVVGALLLAAVALL